MEILKRATLLLLLLAVTACDPTREPTPLALTGEEVMLHSVLTAGSDTAFVVLTTVRPSPGEFGAADTRPLSGATVILAGAGDTIPLTEAPTGFRACVAENFSEPARRDSIAPGCYAAAVPGGIRAGARYELLVQLPGGAPVRGSTSVPAEPSIVRPEPGARFPARINDPDFNRIAATIPVGWTVSMKAAGVRFILLPEAVFRDGARVPDASCDLGLDFLDVRRTTPSDSSFLRVNYILCSRRLDEPGDPRIVPDSIHARLLLTAYDSAYVQYVEAIDQDSAPRSRLIAGIEGALGVFAGAATAERRITLIPVR